MNGISLEDFDTAPCGFLSFSDDGTILSANTTLAKMIKLGSSDELIGKNIETILTTSGRIFYQTHLFPLVRLQGRADEIFVTLKIIDGEGVPVICNAIRKLNEGVATNHCSFFTATHRSKYEQELLLARRQAEDALQQNTGLISAKSELEEKTFSLDRKISELVGLNKEIVQLGYIITHDMQEPLRKISLFADRVKKENKGLLKPQSLVDINKIVLQCSQVRTVAAKLEEIISLSMNEDSMERIELEMLVRSAFDEVLLKSGGEGILTLGNLPAVMGNLDQLIILFFQLLNNSFMYAKPSVPPAITIDATVVNQNSYMEIKEKYRYSNFVRISITDNGSGFEVGANVFNMQRRTFEGSFTLGFGLAICKKIADNHHGSISISSIVGKGTTVIILLPAI